MNNQRLGFLEGWLSIGTNIVLFSLKLWAGAASGSVAMTADAWHTLSDSVTSVIVIAGFWISGRTPDSEHPFGHGRAENIGGIIIATLILVVGFGFLRQSAGRLAEYIPPVYSSLAIGIFVFSAIVKEILARFAIWAGRKTGSGSLMADGCHHRCDALTTAMVLAGIFFGRGLWWMDPALGIAVSVVIIYSAYGILRKTTGAILGERMSPEIEMEILSLIEKDFPEVSYAHHFHIHRYGDHAELTFHVHLPDEFSLKKTHSIINLLEEEIRSRMNLETTIHPGPLSERTEV